MFTYSAFHCLPLELRFSPSWLPALLPAWLPTLLPTLPRGFDAFPPAAAAAAAADVTLPAHSAGKKETSRRTQRHERAKLAERGEIPSADWSKRRRFDDRRRSRRPMRDGNDDVEVDVDEKMASPTP